MEQLGTKKTWQGDTVALDESDEEWYSQVIGQSGEHKTKQARYQSPGEPVGLHSGLAPLGALHPQHWERHRDRTSDSNSTSLAGLGLEPMSAEHSSWEGRA